MDVLVYLYLKIQQLCCNTQSFTVSLWKLLWHICNMFYKEKAQSMWYG